VIPVGAKKIELTTMRITNVFVKPNEQNRACSSYDMARKRRMKSKVFVIVLDKHTPQTPVENDN